MSHQLALHGVLGQAGSLQKCQLFSSSTLVLLLLLLPSFLTLTQCDNLLILQQYNKDKWILFCHEQVQIAESCQLANDKKMTVGERVVTFMTIYLNLFHLPTFPYLHCIVTKTIWLFWQDQKASFKDYKYVDSRGMFQFNVL